jgi:hypothetical protein
MKKVVFLITLMSAFAVRAQGKEAICGIVTQKSLVRADTIVVSIYNTATDDFTEVSVKAVSSAARDFLEVIDIHGAKICNPRAISEAPFEICFSKGGKSGQAETIFCRRKRCQGPHCGGNGFSVNSGN